MSQNVFYSLPCQSSTITIVFTFHYNHVYKILQYWLLQIVVAHMAQKFQDPLFHTHICKLTVSAVREKANFYINCPKHRLVQKLHNGFDHCDVFMLLVVHVILELEL